MIRMPLIRRVLPLALAAALTLPTATVFAQARPAAAPGLDRRRIAGDRGDGDALREQPFGDRAAEAAARAHDQRAAALDSQIHHARSLIS